ncbi:MAG: RNA methyltransferase [Proteobacteria bacterium]|nr:RNA methyltransferase [Pseudomonadota bacterium]
MQRIESRHNPRLRELARLIASSRERRKSRRCVLEGVHLVEVYCDRHGAPEVLVVVDEFASRPDVAALVARVPAVRTLAVSRRLFAEIASLPDEVGVLAVVPVPASGAAAEPAGQPRTGALQGEPVAGSCCLLLEDVQDPGNVGTLLRTAAAAAVDRVVLSTGCAFAWAPRALRAGQGAQFLTRIDEGVDLLDWSARFAKRGGRIVATRASGGAAPWHADLGGNVAIAIGNEGSGLSAALVARADVHVTIPLAPGSESLNAAAAAAVVLFERRRQVRS